MTSILLFLFVLPFQKLPNSLIEATSVAAIKSGIPKGIGSAYLVSLVCFSFGPLVGGDLQFLQSYLIFFTYYLFVGVLSAVLFRVIAGPHFLIWSVRQLSSVRAPKMIFRSCFSRLLSVLLGILI